MNKNCVVSSPNVLPRFGYRFAKAEILRQSLAFPVRIYVEISNSEMNWKPVDRDLCAFLASFDERCLHHVEACWPHVVLGMWTKEDPMCRYSSDELKAQPSQPPSLFL